MAKKRKKKSRSPAPKVEESIQAIRADHKAGSGVLARIGRRASDKVLRAEAESLGLKNVDTVRKLRQFADPEKGYTLEELDELCEVCRKHGHELGRSFVFKFLSIPRENGQRAKFQREAIRNKWSRAEVDNAICARFGRRRHGGKTPMVAGSVDGVLVQADSVCLQFRRLVQTLRDRDDAETSPSLRDLPVDVRSILEVADVFMERMQDLLAKELNRSRHD